MAFDALTAVYYTLAATPHGVVAAGATQTSIPTSDFEFAFVDATGVVADQFTGRVIRFHGNTTTAGLRGAASRITGSTAANLPTLTLDTALATTPVAGDMFCII